MCTASAFNAVSQGGLKPAPPRHVGVRGEAGFAKLGTPGPLGRPRPALSSKNQVLAKIEGPARGPAADQGSVPPIMQVCAREN